MRCTNDREFRQTVDHDQNTKELRDVLHKSVGRNQMEPRRLIKAYHICGLITVLCPFTSTFFG